MRVEKTIDVGTATLVRYRMGPGHWETELWEDGNEAAARVRELEEIFDTVKISGPHPVVRVASKEAVSEERAAEFGNMLRRGY